MQDTYLTIEAPGEAIFKEKMSRFLSFAIPVSSVSEAREYIEMYRKEYYDARHVCWAYMIGHERTCFRANDNGEPSGTAGKPILGQINSNNLTDILVVVVRYFGGIKLGTGGLIVAYKQAAADAIATCNIVERLVEKLCEINCSALGGNGIIETSVCEQPIKSDKILSYEDKYLGGSKSSKSKGM
ncbi:MAG: YigZ family protein, partial [Bacteroidales bacterium]|nr:YigZ family protein [Bacteroidales bacterium]